MNLKINKTQPPASGQTLAPIRPQPKSAFGGGISDISTAILRDFHKYPNDLLDERRERLASVTINLVSRIASLVTHGYLMRLRVGNRVVGAAMTAKGRVALGLEVKAEPTEVREIRFCNASQRGILDLSRDAGYGRIGLAMCGVSGRA
jgi:hypothetical protein